VAVNPLFPSVFFDGWGASGHGPRWCRCMIDLWSAELGVDPEHAKMMAKLALDNDNAIQIAPRARL
jgi:hypothetical protein